MNIQQYARRLQRLRQVAAHIDAHLDQPLRLDELADIAHLSPYHFAHVFTDYAGEAPLARVRRLRLTSARQKLQQGWSGSLLELALDSGYASAEAFSRAFRRAHGCAPSCIQTRGLSDPLPTLRIVKLPIQLIQYLRHEGTGASRLEVFDELRAHALLANIPRQRRKGWSIHWQGRLEDQERMPAREDVLDAGLLSDRLGQKIPGLYQSYIPGGRYAVMRMQGSYATPTGARLEQALAAQGCRLREGPVLRCFHNRSYLPADFERRCDLYIPVDG